MKKIFAGLSVVVAVMSVPASATLLNFSIAGVATFTLDSDPTPAANPTHHQGSGFGINGVAITYSGSTTLNDLYFFQDGTNNNGDNLLQTAEGQPPYDPTQPYGPNNYPPMGVGIAGPQIYSGTNAHPHFSEGQYGQVKISTISAAPEPASWAMMLSGFGLVGFAMRNRRNRSKSSPNSLRLLRLWTVLSIAIDAF